MGAVVWAEGGGDGDDGGDNRATAAVAVWGMHNEGDGGEGAVLSMDNDMKQTSHCHKRERHQWETAPMIR